MPPGPGRLLRPILFSASAIALITVGAKVLGFLEKIFQAGNLGTSADLDAYLVAISVPTSLYVFTREVIEPAVLPVYLELRHERHADARRFAAAAGLTILAAGGLVLLYLHLDAGRVIRALAPGLEPATHDLTVRLSRGTFVGGLLFAFSALTAILLNAHRRFALPASGDLAMKALLAAGFGWAVVRWDILAMAWVFALACAARLAVHLPAVVRHVGIGRPIGPRHPASRKAMKLALPLLVGMAFSQLGGFADNHFLSRLGEGVISALSFGRKLVDLPLLLVSYSISIVVFPYFADLHIRNDRDRSLALLRRTLRFTMLVFAWITALLLPLAADVVRVVFERGAFDDRSVEMTAPVLTAYAIGLVPLALESIVVQHFFARKDVVRPVAAGMLGVVVHVGLLAATWQWLGPASAALTYVFSKTIKLGILFRWASDWGYPLRQETSFLGRLFLISAAVGLLTVAASAVPAVSSLGPLPRLVALGALGSFLFAGAAWSSGVLPDALGRE